MSADLAAIEARANAFVLALGSEATESIYYAELDSAAQEFAGDVPALLAMAREQAAQLEAVRDIADEWDSPRLHAILDSGTEAS